MKKLKDYIQAYGEAKDTNILKVDAFLNHQIDPILMEEIAHEFANYFKDKKITKIMTIETSGIAPALMCGWIMKLPVVFLKKATSRIHDEHLYQSNVHSYTKDIDYTLTCSHHYIQADDHILLIDDFLANGEACLGAIQIIEQAQASIVGIGIVIEKSFQAGRALLEAKNIDVYSLARIKKLDKDYIEFIEE